MPAPTAFTPAVQTALNLEVVNQFRSGFALGTSRISGLLNVCGPRTSSSEHLVVLIAGKNFNLYRRARNEKDLRLRKANAYEQRSKLGNYADFLVIDRMDVIYDRWGVVMLTSETAGAEAAEGPTRMVEALVPVAMAIECYTGEPYWSATQPIKPGSATTYPNVQDLGALDFSSFDEAEKLLAHIPDEDGHRTNNQVRRISCGPVYKQIALEIAKNRYPKDYAGGINLRADQMIEVDIVPDWDEDLWMVSDTRQDSDMPFYFVEGRPLAVRPLYTDVNGSYETLENMLVWAVDGDMAAALGNPRKAFLSANPANAEAIAAKYAAKYELNDFDFTLE